MAYRGGYGGNSWQGSGNPNMAPLPHRPGRGGIGSHDPAQGQTSSNYGASTSSNAAAPASSAGIEAATTVFVGSISGGIADSWLTQLLEACGHLRSLKRASKAFAFAEYADPDSVIRAISVLNGRELPSMGAESSTPAKKLLVKADEKTKRFLEQYQQSRISHGDDARRDDHAMSLVGQLIHQMSEPNAAIETDSSRPGYSVPDHLKDLPPEELPEESRNTVLSEIEHFRQAAAARDAETRRREADMEKQRATDRARRAAPSSSRHSADDPQSYRRPVDFHAPSRDEDVPAHREPEEQDEIDWQRKQESIASRKKALAADAERSFSVRERQRLAHWEREADREKADRDRSEREAVSLLRKWEDWRDETATRRELFHADRKRWRQFRATARRREEEVDEQDRVAEAQEIVRAREETERFLAQQAADMAKLTEQQRASGVLFPTQSGSIAPLKLTFSSTNKAASDTQNTGALTNGGPAKAAPVVSVLGEADDDDREKRASRLKHIQLTADTDALSDDPAQLLKQIPDWQVLDATTIDTKYRSWVDAEIEESLGEKVEELVSVVIDCLHAKKSAQDIMEAVEPVLDDEAEAFVAKLWRMLLSDSQG